MPYNVLYMYSSSMYNHAYSMSKDQPGKVANPGRGQLNTENELQIDVLRHRVSPEFIGSRNCVPMA